MEKSIDKNRTNYLKGLVISAVMINHYLNFFILDNISHLSNRLISAFFILSGSAIFFSLEKRIENNKQGIKLISGFYFDRFLRIFPLYWAALFLLYGGQVTACSFLAIKAPGIFWFICAIVHCYLLAPIFFLFLKKAGTKKYIVIITLAFLFLNAFLFFFSNEAQLRSALARPFGYLNLFLFHILFFALGLSIPNINKRLFFSKGFFLISFILFLAIIITAEFDLSPEIYILLVFCLAATVFLALMSFLKSKPRMILKNIFCFIGRNVYSAYLFHIAYFYLLFYLGIIKKGSYTSLLIMALISPLFFLALDFLEKNYNRLLKALRS